MGVRNPSRGWADLAGICPGTRFVTARGTAGACRNVVVEHATGEVLLFLDDDVVADPRLLARLATLAQEHPDVEVFGGPNVTPPRSTFFQTVQGAVLASIVGSGPVRRRYGKHPPGHADEMFFILCNLAIRRRSMLHFGPELVCAEENALLLAMTRRGLAMYYDPELVVFHERRSDIAAFARQMLKYGRGRGQIISGNPVTARTAFLAPSILTIYVALLLVLVPVTVYALVPGTVYLLAVVVNAAHIASTLRRGRALLLAVRLTLVLHFAYGLGVVRGVFAPSAKLARYLPVADVDTRSAPVREHREAPDGMG